MMGQLCLLRKIMWYNTKAPTLLNKILHSELDWCIISSNFHPYMNEKSPLTGQLELRRRFSVVWQCDWYLNTPWPVSCYLLSSPGVLYCPSASGPSAKPSNISFNHSRDRWSRSSVRQPESVRWEKLTTPAFSSASTMDWSERYASRRKQRKSDANYIT